MENPLLRSHIDITLEGLHSSPSPESEAGILSWLIDFARRGQDMNADISPPALISKNPAARYAVAILTTAVALLACRALDSSLPDHVPYVMLFPAVAFSAWYCGVGPSIQAVFRALLGPKYQFTPPRPSRRIPSAREFIAMLLFLFATGIVAAMGEA